MSEREGGREGGTEGEIVLLSMLSSVYVEIESLDMFVMHECIHFS